VIHRNESFFGGIDGEPLRVRCERIKTRYVRLRIDAVTALHLDAVEIYNWHKKAAAARGPVARASGEPAS
jgi:hypothetical protein